MKNINDLIGSVRYRTESDFFTISGRLVHWSLLIIPGWWLINVALLLLFYGQWTTLLIHLGSIIILTTIQLLGLNFRIRIDRSEFVLQLKFWGIAFRTVRSQTKDVLLIPDAPAEIPPISIISPTKDYYYEEMKDHLVVSFVASWEDDHPYLEVHFKNKEVDLAPYNEELVWNHLITGLKWLDGYQSRIEE